METGNELEQMRGQLATLKEKLSQQQIVSDRLLHTTLHQLSQESNWRYGINIGVTIFMLPFCWFIFGRMGLSVLFRVVTMIWYVSGVVLGYYFNRRLRGLERSDLLTAGRRIAVIIRMTGLYRNFFTLSCVVWIAWFCIELYAGPADWKPMLVGGGACVAGLIVGYMLNLRQQKRYEALREELDQLIRI